MLMLMVKLMLFTARLENLSSQSFSSQPELSRELVSQPSFLSLFLQKFFEGILFDRRKNQIKIMPVCSSAEFVGLEDDNQSEERTEEEDYS